MTRVLIADDDALVRGGIAMLLTGQPDLDIVGQVGDGGAAVAQAVALRVDVVIMDLRMPGVDGVQATRRLTSDRPEDPDALTKVLVLTTFNDDESVYAALRAGASGFLVKDSAPQHLLTAVRTIAAGEGWLDTSVAGSVIKAVGALPEVRSTAATGGLIARLTPREQEVLELMAHGLSNSDIRERLTLSEATVRTHVSRIVMKTGSRDRTQAVVLAYRSGLVRAPA